MSEFGSTRCNVSSFAIVFVQILTRLKMLIAHQSTFPFSRSSSNSATRGNARSTGARKSPSSHSSGFTALASVYMEFSHCWPRNWNTSSTRGYRSIALPGTATRAGNMSGASTKPVAANCRIASCTLCSANRSYKCPTVRPNLSRRLRNNRRPQRKTTRPEHDILRRVVVCLQCWLHLLDAPERSRTSTPITGT